MEDNFVVCEEVVSGSVTLSGNSTSNLSWFVQCKVDLLLVPLCMTYGTNKVFSEANNDHTWRSYRSAL